MPVFRVPLEGDVDPEAAVGPADDARIDGVVLPVNVDGKRQVPGHDGAVGPDLPEVLPGTDVTVDRVARIRLDLDPKLGRLRRVELGLGHGVNGHEQAVHHGLCPHALHRKVFERDVPAILEPERAGESPSSPASVPVEAVDVERCGSLAHGAEGERMGVAGYVDQAPAIDGPSRVAGVVGQGRRDEGVVDPGRAEVVHARLELEDDGAVRGAAGFHGSPEGLRIVRPVVGNDAERLSEVDDDGFRERGARGGREEKEHAELNTDVVHDYLVPSSTQTPCRAGISVFPAFRGCCTLPFVVFGGNTLDGHLCLRARRWHTDARRQSVVRSVSNPMLHR